MSIFSVIPKGSSAKQAIDRNEGFALSRLDYNCKASKRYLAEDLRHGKKYECGVCKGLFVGGFWHLDAFCLFANCKNLVVVYGEAFAYLGCISSVVSWDVVLRLRIR
ncbi:MAG: hypothetical protein POH28_11390 [Acidocella sp.]|nr:hypothetical protein [Acidocella sp.]